MEGHNYLEQLQFKKQAKKPPVINLDFGNKSKDTKTAKIGAPKPKVVELEEGKLDESDVVIESEPEKRKEIQMKDLRGKVPVDYELIMKRLQTHNITGVVDMVSRKPDVIVSNTAMTVPKPAITKTAAKTVIEEGELIEKHAKDSIQSSDIFGQLTPNSIPSKEPLSMEKVVPVSEKKHLL